jgi:Spy/CpxP family protein refolding chaperone
MFTKKRVMKYPQITEESMVVNSVAERNVVGNDVLVTPARRLSWTGIIAGVIVGVVTYAALLILGVAVGFIGLEDASLSGVATGSVIWLGISLAFSSFLAGLTAARAAGNLTPARGRFNGLVVGMILMLLMSIFTLNLVSRGISSLVNLAGSVVGTAANAAGSAAGAATDENGGLGGALESLGIQNEYQALVSGFNEEELTQLIAEASPELNETQVGAAVSVVTDELQAAGRNIGNNLADVSNLGDVITRQADAVQTALSGEQFVQNLAAEGLTPEQAQEVSTVIGQRVTETRQQIQQTALVLQERTAELAEAAARAAARAAWIWLLMAGVTLLFSSIGGGFGKDIIPDEAVIDRPRETVRT